VSEFYESIVRLEPWFRLGAFLTVFAVLAALETLCPRRSRSFTRSERWPANIGLSLINSLTLRVLVAVAAVAAAVFAEANGIGLFAYVHLPVWAETVVALILLDLVVYTQHVVLHHVPFLWRLHRIHHADPDLDVTTGLRFHTIEIVLSQFLKVAVVLLLGAPAVAVILFEILLNATTMFNHANLRLSPGLDAIVRAIVVTPDMHRVHHSIRPEEHNSNFGFNLSLWDRLFGTYRAEPREDHMTMPIGLSGYPGRSAIGLRWLLTNPFAAAPKPGPRNS
jgi:sterol desaturase/sphingolipid hydroxylase (fatty acid hydroxylase superfamily)